MIALIQRVTEASVRVGGRTIAAIGPGMVALIGVEPADDPAEVERMAARLLRLRVFEDAEGRMNLDLGATGGDLLLVPQFTLLADTDSGHRPSFGGAAPPEQARALFDALRARCLEHGQRTESGQFGADMQLALVNDGPATFILKVRRSRF